MKTKWLQPKTVGLIKKRAMPVIKMKELLDDNGIKYVTFKHSPAYTAQEVAQSAHISGKNVAKIVILKIDDKMTMAVIPASHQVNLESVKDAATANKVELACEQEFRDVFPDCEPGAMPPFGNLYGMNVFVSEALAADEAIVFNAGTHTELVGLAYRDFERLVKPQVGNFSS
jgi:Ala-tRNA(Pro) deacylase